MEKRAIYAILLTFIIIMIWSLVQSKFFPPPPNHNLRRHGKSRFRPPEKSEKTELKNRDY